MILALRGMGRDGWGGREVGVDIARGRGREGVGG